MSAAKWQNIAGFKNFFIPNGFIVHCERKSPSSYENCVKHLSDEKWLSTYYFGLRKTTVSLEKLFKANTGQKGQKHKKSSNSCILNLNVCEYIIIRAATAAKDGKVWS